MGGILLPLYGRLEARERVFFCRRLSNFVEKGGSVVAMEEWHDIDSIICPRYIPPTHRAYRVGERVEVTRVNRIVGLGMSHIREQRGRIVWVGPRFVVVEFRGAGGSYREAFLTFRAQVNDDIRTIGKREAG